MIGYFKRAMQKGTLERDRGDYEKKKKAATEALKKAHAKELAAHVQEHNRKYNQLLQDKMDSEDALKEQAEHEKKKLNSSSKSSKRKACKPSKMPKTQRRLNEG